MDDTWRGTIYFGFLFLLIAAELFLPRRDPSYQGRWVANIALTVTGNLIIRLALPLGLVAIAAPAPTGLMAALGLEGWAAILLCIVLLDFVLWTQHWLLHRVPLLWRLHRVHHQDADFDVTTALRFHPFELILSTSVKLAAILALGAPVEAVMLFESLLGIAALFGHANLNLPPALERVLQPIIVTPDYHAIHHATVPEQHNSNYGFFLTIWDRLFATLSEATKADVGAVAFGLGGKAPEGGAFTRLTAHLTDPFRR